MNREKALYKSHTLMDELPIINSSYEFHKKLVDMTTRIEKRFRYSLAGKIEELSLSLIELLIMAKHAPKTLKAGYLIKSVAYLETIRLMLRLMLELGCVEETAVFKLQEQAAETGRMLGGWLRSLS